MKESQLEKAPSSRRPLDGTGVLRIPGRKQKQKLRVATWNVRSLKREEKVYNVAMEMGRLGIEILGLSDVKMTGNGRLKIHNNKTLYYSGSDTSYETYGVAIVLSSHIDSAVTNVIPLSNRAIMIQMNTKPRKMNIIQVYAPTADKPSSEIEHFYSEVEQLYNLTKKEDINILMGDFNAKVGEGELPGVVGKWGLGDRNDRGDLLVQFCQEKELVITNTLFKMPVRRRYTWTSPAHTEESIVRNQIDFVIINSRFKNCISSAKTYPGADIGSDHNPVVTDISCQLKYLRKRSKKGVDIKKLSRPDVRPKVHSKVNSWAAEYKSKSPQTDPSDIWPSMKVMVSDINSTDLKPSNEN